MPAIYELKVPRGSAKTAAQIATLYNSLHSSTGQSCPAAKCVVFGGLPLSTCRAWVRISWMFLWPFGPHGLLLHVMHLTDSIFLQPTHHCIAPHSIKYMLGYATRSTSSYSRERVIKFKFLVGLTVSNSPLVYKLLHLLGSLCSLMLNS